MSSGLPRRIQVLNIQGEGRRYAGGIAPQDLTRLADNLAQSGERVIDAELQIVPERPGSWLADLTVRIDIPLQCQRCLQPMRWATKLDARLLLLSIDSGRDGAPQLDVVELEEGTLDVAALIEDEILLALPIAPLHGDNTQCGSSQVDRMRAAARPDHPFAALAALKPKH